MYRRLSGKINIDNCCVACFQCSAIKKNVVVASQLYDGPDIQFTVEKEGSFELLQFIQKNSFGNSVPNIVIMLRIFITIVVSVATCESFSKLKLIKNYLRYSMSTLRMRNLDIPSIEQQLTDEINFDIAVEVFANKKARKVTV